ncbi:MAG: PspA/IM30 family protein [Armatimonadetes bacterium]|nr:PspA/IM30 family protein [Armatimonadota bacterium]
MGLLQRLRRIISANINALLERAEDPRRMLDELIREMEGAVRDTQDNAAKAIAGLQALHRKREEQEELVRRWDQRAEEALRGGDEEAAREALRRKLQHQGVVEGLERQIQRQQEAVDALKRSLTALRAKLEEARARAEALKAAAAGAEAQRVAAQAVGATADTSAFDEFERMAERIERRADELEAAAELDVDAVEASFAEAEEQQSVEAELEALRRRISETEK